MLYSLSKAYPQGERFVKLNQIAIHRMRVLEDDGSRELNKGLCDLKMWYLSKLPISKIKYRSDFDIVLMLYITLGVTIGQQQGRLGNIIWKSSTFSTGVPPMQLPNRSMPKSRSSEHSSKE